jgi:hypothetical protein
MLYDMINDVISSINNMKRKREVHLNTLMKAKDVFLLVIFFPFTSGHNSRVMEIDLQRLQKWYSQVWDTFVILLLNTNARYTLHTGIRDKPLGLESVKTGTHHSKA